MTASLQSYSLIALVIYFLILMYVVYRNRQVKSMEEYFLAGRNLPFWALSLTFGLIVKIGGCPQGSEYDKNHVTRKKVWA